ncbi:MAG: translation elongation factor Ts, partial [Abitibacteriaceae bacterium]|nr:translation elongation factor Ts [Abditibacteriaceae bacterium]
MASVDAAAVKKLREMTSAGIMDCKGALAEAGGDFDKAATILREKGIASAAKKADRAAGDGSLGLYVHTDGKQAALVEVNCETDFVAKTEEFKALCREIAMQIVALKPLYVR